MKKNYFINGQWNAICDVCGWKYKSGQLRKRWDGLMVCEYDFEMRHPLDFIRIPVEQNNVQDSRPEGNDQYLDNNYGIYNHRVMGNLVNNCRIG